MSLRLTEDEIQVIVQKAIAKCAFEPTDIHTEHTRTTIVVLAESAVLRKVADWLPSQPNSHLMTQAIMKIRAAAEEP